MEVETGVTQTIDPALCSTEVQTDVVESSVTEVQTECIQGVMKCVKDAVTQSDLDMKVKTSVQKMFASDTCINR